MPTITYNPREVAHLALCDRVVLRLQIQGEWREAELRPEPGDSLLTKLMEVQKTLSHQLRHHPDQRIALQRSALQLAGTHPVEGEVRVSVPRDHIPPALAAALSGASHV